MEAKILNFPDAMKLASIVSRYVEIPDGEKTAIDFIDDFVSKITPVDYLDCIKLFIGEVDKNKLPTGEALIEILYTGMRNNNIFSLLNVYKNLGFI